jgi:hypothetical protein
VSKLVQRMATILDWRVSIQESVSRCGRPAVRDSSDRLIRNVPPPRIETYWLATKLPRLTIGIGALPLKGQECS